MSRDGNGFTAKTFEFFAELENNNDKAWFDANRSTYHEYARDPFAALLEELSDRLADTALPLHGGTSTMFRINRDVRFSEDKRPYSESVSGLLTATGTKDESGPLVYVQLDADGGRCGGGMHRPTAKQLEPVRRRMIDELDDFGRVVETLHDHDLAIEMQDQVKTMPRGFGDHSDHPHADYVRCTQLLAMAEIAKSAFVDDSAGERIARAALGLKALYDFIDRANSD